MRWFRRAGLGRAVGGVAPDLGGKSDTFSAGWAGSPAQFEKPQQKREPCAGEPKCAGVPKLEVAKVIVESMVRCRYSSYPDSGACISAIGDLLLPTDDRRARSPRRECAVSSTPSSVMMTDGGPHAPAGGYPVLFRAFQSVRVCAAPRPCRHHPVIFANPKLQREPRIRPPSHPLRLERGNIVRAGVIRAQLAIEMDELPACDLPGAVRGDGDQGVAAGVIADRSRIGRGVRDGTIHAEIQARDVSTC